MASNVPAATGTLDFGGCFRRVTDDPAWVRKTLVGGAFVLLAGFLVGLPFVLGYYGRVLRNTAAGQAQPLPEWDDLGGLFSDGLGLLAVYLGHVLGVVVVLAALGCVAALPALLVGGLHGRGGSGAVAALSGLGLLAVYALALLLSLALGVYLPAALARAAIHGRVASGFDWRGNVAFVRANLGNYLLALLVYLLAGFVAQFGTLLCCVGVFPATFWSHATGAIAIGETARLNRGSTGP
jgi:hypothetical protein